MSDLLPCPFCGGDPALVVGAVAFNDYEVQCDTCGFSGPNFGSLDQEPFPREDAIKHWNTRTALDALLKAGREKALREAVENLSVYAPSLVDGPEHDVGYYYGYTTALHRVLDLISEDKTDG